MRPSSGLHSAPAQRMRVLFVNPLGGLGGSERSLLDLLASLCAGVPAVEPRLLLLADGELAARARALGVETDILPLPAELGALGESSAERPSIFERAPALLRGALDSAPYLLALRRYVRAVGPDIVHTNGMKAHLLLALGAGGRPRVIHLRDFAGARALSRRLLPLVARRALVVTNSLAVERDALDVAPKLRTRVVYNGVDLDEFKPGAADRSHLAALAGLAPPAPAATVIGLVATYAWWKGHRTFLTAAARLVASEPERRFRFYVVGGPIYGRSDAELEAGDLTRLIGELGLEGSVGLVPFQANAAAVYRGLDVVVHASERPEPFGRTIVEGMASGRPVVVARGGGARELFTEGESAVGHEPGNADDLARTLSRLVQDDALRARLAVGGRAEAERRFDRKRLGAELHAAYAALLGRGLR